MSRGCVVFIHHCHIYLSAMLVWHVSVNIVTVIKYFLDVAHELEHCYYLYSHGLLLKLKD
jgi:hypothetical protein